MIRSTTPSSLMSSTTTACSGALIFPRRTSSDFACGRVRGKPSDEPVIGGAGGRRELLLDEADGEVVGDEGALVDVDARLPAEGGVAADGVAEHVAGGDVGDAEFGGQAFRLGTLPHAGGAHEEEPHLPIPLDAAGRPGAAAYRRPWTRVLPPRKVP